MDKRSFPMLTMPSPEDHRRASLAWLERVRPMLIDQWSPALHDLSMPTTLHRLSPEAVEMLLDAIDGKAAFADMDHLAAQLDALMGWDRKFVRLNSRSPKDAPYPFEVPATISGKEAISILISSMRIVEDLIEFKYVPEQPAYICLREFVPWLRGSNEFRCFVKNGALIAVSHYDYTKEVPVSYIEHGPDIRQKIETYFNERLHQHLPLDNIVFDVGLGHGDDLLLVEINPYGLSDPCWFGSYENVERAVGPVQFAAPNVEPAKPEWEL